MRCAVQVYHIFRSKNKLKKLYFQNKLKIFKCRLLRPITSIYNFTGYKKNIFVNKCRDNYCLYEATYNRNGVHPQFLRSTLPIFQLLGHKHTQIKGSKHRYRKESDFCRQKLRTN